MSGSGLSLWRLLRRSLSHRKSRTAAELAALTISAAVATAMLTLYGSLNMKLHHQFRAFGANIIVTASDRNIGANAGPASLPAGALEAAQRAAGPDARVVPFAYAIAQMQDGSPIVIAGTDLEAARTMNSWWQIRDVSEPASSGTTAAPQPLEINAPRSVAPISALTGVRAANALGANQFELSYNGRSATFNTAQTLRTGDAEDSRVVIPLNTFTRWTDVPLTTLEIQAPGDSRQVQAALARLRRALPGAEVHPVHRLVEAEAGVVSRTRSLMFSSLWLILLAVAVCVLAALSASVLERRRDFAVMKALGASGRQVEALFLIEVLLLALVGLCLGYGIGCGIADLIGEWNFHTAIAPLWRVAIIAGALNLAVAFLAAAIPLRMLRRLEPAQLLRGD
jgi:putative ABC transport system permease protein